MKIAFGTGTLAMLMLVGGTGEAQRTKSVSGGSRSAARSSAGPQAVFTFKGLTAGQEGDPAVLGQCATEPRNDMIICKAGDDTIGGVPTMMGLNYSLVGNRFAGLDFTFMTYGGKYEQLDRALTDRYGKACTAGVTPYVSPIGVRTNFPNKAWCFKTGKLVLKSYGMTKDIGSLTYRDKIHPPALVAAPVRDF